MWVSAVLKQSSTISATRFEAPITDLGFTALSVDMRINFPTPWRKADKARVCVPTALFATTAKRFCSIRGTCLKAAA